MNKFQNSYVFFMCMLINFMCKGKIRRLVILFDCCQLITNVYCAQLTIESACTFIAKKLCKCLKMHFSGHKADKIFIICTAIFRFFGQMTKQGCLLSSLFLKNLYLLSWSQVEFKTSMPSYFCWYIFFLKFLLFINFVPERYYPIRRTLLELILEIFL